jgi:hypothetical protein
LIVITVSLIIILMNWFDNRFPPLLWKFLLIAFGTNKFVYLRTYHD